MADSNNDLKDKVLLGLGAMAVSLLMGTGEWSIFDFGLSLAILAFGGDFIRRQQIFPKTKWETSFFALSFAVVTTAGLIGLASVLVPIFPTLAQVDTRIYKKIFQPSPGVTESQLYSRQVGWQVGLFLASVLFWVIYFGYVARTQKPQETQEQEAPGKD